MTQAKLEFNGKHAMAKIRLGAGGFASGEIVADCAGCTVIDRTFCGRAMGAMRLPLHDEKKWRETQSTVRWHVLAFVAGNIAIMLVDLQTAGSTWFHWVFLAWGAGLLGHVMWWKLSYVDEDWANERAERIQRKGYVDVYEIKNRPPEEASKNLDS